MPPPPLPIDGLLADIERMDTQMAQEACGTEFGPMIQFGTGTPPVIDFNMPEGTAFTTYGHILKFIPNDYFREFTKKVPTNNYFDLMENMSNDQAAKLLHPNVTTGGQFIPGAGFVPAGSGNVPSGGFTGVPPGGWGAHTTITPTAGGSVSPSSGGGIVLGHANKALIQGAVAQSNSPKVSPGVVQVGVNAWGDPIVVPAPWPNVVDFAKQNLRPMVDYRILNQGPIVRYQAKPPAAVPRISIIEEYTTVSYLGNYGAGRVVNTFSLYPGERTTISIRTYKDRASSSSKSDNILDSFSESAATELDTLIQKEQGDSSASSDTTGGSGSSYSTNTDAKNSTSSMTLSASLHTPFLTVGGGYGQSESDMSSSGSGMTNSYDYDHTAMRQSNVNTLNNAMNKHVQQSNANRQMEVNTTTTTSQREGEENTTVRDIVNYNKSRVLNLVCRQLNQKYTTITYLSGLKFEYTNGYAESNKIVDLANLKNMLKDIIKDGEDPDPVEFYRNKVLCKLLQPYCTVINYADVEKQFISYKEITYGGCLPVELGCEVLPAEVYFRRNPSCTDTWGDGPSMVTFKGVILSIEEQVLHTSSVIWDALLGRGEALDCFNQKAQEAESQASFIRNLASMQQVEDSVQTTANKDLIVAQQLEVITATDPVQQPVAYKKVFGNCCPTPQYTGGCGCGNCNDTP